MMRVLMLLWVAKPEGLRGSQALAAARRAGNDIGRDQTARLMRELGIRGVSRRRKVFTPKSDPDAWRAQGIGRFPDADRTHGDATPPARSSTRTTTKTASTSPVTSPPTIVQIVMSLLGFDSASPRERSRHRTGQATHPATVSRPAMPETSCTRSLNNSAPRIPGSSGFRVGACRGVPSWACRRRAGSGCGGVGSW